jgi:hypothetical protein
MRKRDIIIFTLVIVILVAVARWVALSILYHTRVKGRRGRSGALLAS